MDLERSKSDRPSKNFKQLTSERDRFTYDLHHLSFRLENLSLDLNNLTSEHEHLSFDLHQLSFRLEYLSLNLNHLTSELDQPSFDLKILSQYLNLSLNILVAFFCGGNRIRRNHRDCVFIDGSILKNWKTRPKRIVK